MTWLLGVALRPLGALLFFGFALVAARLLSPLIPSGRIKDILYDRSIKKNHPWKFAIGALVAIYGTAALVGWWATS